jgi:hypothetical protein
MTVPHFGKREPGALTAASPGDTLYFAFGSYNDSGDSEALSGLAVTDIEVIKDGQPTVRATDSGYSLVSDTGMIGNRPGLYRVSIQLFNTADDASFYASGSWYNAFIDAVTIDGKTVRFHLGSWEIGRQRVNVWELAGDTGAAGWLKSVYANGFTDTGLYDTLADYDTGTKQRLGQIQSDVDTGLRDTLADYDTGLRDFITDAKNELDTGGVNVTATVDTGVINQAVWQGNASRTITSFDVDTGLRDLIADRFTELDTGLRDFITDAKNELDTGGVNVVAVVDTGVINQAVWQTDAQRKLTVDTGIADQVWMQARSAYNADTGTFGEHLGGSLGTAVVDTGVVNQAVWQGNASRTITSFDVDTGLRDLISDRFTELDTGLRDFITDAKNELDTGGVNVTATVDTGVINQAVWQANAARSITASSDTGINDHLSRIRADVDTGLRTHIDDLDTGLHDVIAELDTGMRGLFAAADTGKIATAVWAGDTGLRDLINDRANELDTGLHDTLADYDTGIRGILNTTGVFVSRITDTGLYDTIADYDTGTKQRLGQILSDTDTGLKTIPTAIKAKTDSLTFTVAGQVDSNIQYVNDVAIAGAGDTGTGNTWRPA